MAGKVLASRSPWDRESKLMMSLSPSPASLVSVNSHTVGMGDILDFNEMVQVYCCK